MITNPASLTHDDLLDLLIQAALLTVKATCDRHEITASSRYEYEPGTTLVVMVAIDPDGWYVQVLLDEHQIVTLHSKAHVTGGAVGPRAFGIIEQVRIAILAAGYDVSAPKTTRLMPGGAAHS